MRVHLHVGPLTFSSSDTHRHRARRRPAVQRSLEAQLAVWGIAAFIFAATVFVLAMAGRS